VTPWAPRARDRALHAAIVALARHKIPGMLEEDSPTLSPANEQKLMELVEELLARATAVDPDEKDGVRRDAEAFIAAWRNRGQLGRYWLDRIKTKSPQSLLVSAEMAAKMKTLERTGQLVARPTLNSMREVEPSVAIKMVNRLAESTKSGGAS